MLLEMMLSENHVFSKPYIRCMFSICDLFGYDDTCQDLMIIDLFILFSIFTR